jgi:transcriptional regulator
MRNEIQVRISQLAEKGWTLAAIAGELGVTPLTVGLWKAGKRNPTNVKSVLLMLDKILEKKRIPKKRRYAKGSRQRAEIRR